MLANTVLFHIKSKELSKVESGMIALTRTALPIQGKPKIGISNGNHFYMALVKVKTESELKKLNKIVEMVT